MKTSLFGTTLNRVQLSGLKNMKRRESSMIGDDELITKLTVENVRFELIVTSNVFKLPITGSISHVNCDAKLDYNSTSGAISLIKFDIVNMGNFTIEVSDNQESTLGNELGKFLLETVLEGFKSDIKDLIQFKAKETLSRIISWSKNAQLLMKLSRHFYTFRSSNYYAWITPPFIISVHYIVPYLI